MLLCDFENRFPLTEKAGCSACVTLAKVGVRKTELTNLDHISEDQSRRLRVDGDSIQSIPPFWHRPPFRIDIVRGIGHGSHGRRRYVVQVSWSVQPQ